MACVLHMVGGWRSKRHIRVLFAIPASNPEPSTDLPDLGQASTDLQPRNMAYTQESEHKSRLASTSSRIGYVSPNILGFGTGI